MKQATLTETKNNLSALIEQVRHGETVVVLDRGRPVARIVPVQEEAEEPNGRVLRLERQGVVRRAEAEVPRQLLQAEPPTPRRGASVVSALIEERRSGR